MAGTKEIKRRIKSVKSTKKITKAMELVAASKMKRAVSSTLASRLYANYSWELLTSFVSQLENSTHPFLNKREEVKNKILYILITSNRGLCGGYNAQVIKKIIANIKNNKDNVDVITIGKKGDNAMRRLGLNVTMTFLDLPDNLTLRDIDPLALFIKEKFKDATYDEVYLVYTNYVSALTQKPETRKLLPISKEELKESIESIGEERSKENLNQVNKNEYLFEGNINELTEELAEKLVKMQIYQMFLESNASEQSARMMSMKNAGDAATEMIDDLTLVFNKARQANITREISEISAGMASIT
ncbi:MAG: ATP synthase F1 subunit gamma [Candidatus Pacebacteria bacterium]|jgi:F-type H+-transporting ATPase subunit gamma|nr:ATP synthase F1 subunit gamma [Candidatus Paceibacterota bacterium]